MDSKDRVEQLRGTTDASPDDWHPIIELTDEELRRIAGGAAMMLNSGKSSSYSASAPAICCDGTKVCCN